MPTLKHVDFEAPDWRELAAGPVAWAGYANRLIDLGPVGYWRGATGSTIPAVIGASAALTAGTLTPIDGPLTRDATPAAQISGRASADTDPAWSGLADFTFALWLYWDSPPSIVVTAVYAACVYQTTGNQRSWAITSNGGGTDAVQLALSADGSAFTSHAPIAWSALAVGWNFLAFTRAGTTLSRYLNGALVGSETYSSTLHASSAPLVIGQRGDNGQGQWNNLRCAELAVFDRGLSAEAIGDLHDRGRGMLRLSA